MERKLFLEDGHLADEGLQNIIQCELDEMGNLEASEHLGYCDQCLTRYLALLEDDALLTPSAPLRGKILEQTNKTKKKSKFIQLGKYTTVAAAGILVMVMWGSGFFSALPDWGRQPPEPARAQRVEGPRFSSWLNETAANITVSINQFFRPAHSPADPGEEDKESVFRDKNFEPDQTGQNPAPSNPASK